MMTTLNPMSGVKFQAAMPQARATESAQAPAQAASSLLSFSGGAQAMSAYNRANIHFAGSSEIDKPGVDTLLANLDQVQNWSIQILPETVTLSGELNGTQYKLLEEQTGETETRDDGKEYYVTQDSLLITTADGTQEVVELTPEQAKALGDQAEVKAYAQIEQAYGMGKNLDVSPILMKLAEQTLNGELSWEQIDSAIGFEDILPTMSDATKTVMPDGTEVLLMQKSNFFSSETFMGLKKPGLPPQSVRVSCEGNEGDAVDLLNSAHQILNQEEEIREAQQQVAEARTELAGQIAAKRIEP